MSEIIFLVEESVEGGYTARALGHSIFTEADSWEALRIAIQEAVNCHFESANKPLLIRMHMVRDEVFAV